MIGFTNTGRTDLVIHKPGRRSHKSGRRVNLMVDLKNREPHGIERWYSDSGKLKTEYTNNMGRKNGPAKKYFQGHLRKSCFMKMVSLKVCRHLFIRQEKFRPGVL
ncbi:MAG: hypothetical protein GY834_12285 [Bacteroidetes bacterium]|nr:hypothetical protein [Bacteroidota bacterium]